MQEKYEYKITDVNNKYVDDSNAYDLGIKYRLEGKYNDAILCFEAVTKQTNNINRSNAWRQLGEVHQENDDDKYALRAFVEGIKCDKYNPDILLHLAVSCTNELNENEAITFLRMWLVAIFPETSDEIKNTPDKWNDILPIMDRIFGDNKSVELSIALGVLKFIGRN